MNLNEKYTKETRPYNTFESVDEVRSFYGINESSSLFNHCVNILLDMGWSMSSAESYLKKCSDFALNKIYDTNGRCLSNSYFAKYLPKNVKESKQAVTDHEEELAREQEEKEKKKKSVNKPSDEKLDVVYAKIGEYGNIFKHIILFTNDDDPKHNKTLKNIYDAIKNIKSDKDNKNVPELHIFIAEEVTYKLDEDTNELTIMDGNTTLKIDEEDNSNTLVFSRLGVQGEEQCEHVVQVLQDRGFLVLNPVRYSELASNKYDTAVLLQKGEIPQPNFCLMTSDILYDEKLFFDSMKQVYPDWNKDDADKNEDKKLVVKILDGHGGTGVALIDGKKLTAWLQMVFAIDPERQLIIQKKEEADGGDIRVHVLTLRNKQVILAAMKRVKLSGDFRSNVSLGAEAEPVKLTPEQEQIALKTAKLSHLPWCAVDIMPLVKGSNPELGDNAVLEINASPGTDGISDVIKDNFVNIIINELDNPKEFLLQDKTAGYLETVEIDFGSGPVKLLAKLDTGNGSTASHVEVGKLEVTDKKVKFNFNGQDIELDKVGDSRTIAGDSHYVRPIVIAKSVKLGQRIIPDCQIALVESREKNSNVLLNRETLSYLGYTVSPSQTHILTTEMEKVKII